MSFNASALKLMLDKGLSLADVVEIASANERRADPTAAERKRRQRERDKSRRDVTRDKGSNDKDILTSKTSPVVSDETTTAPEEIILLPEHVVEAWNDLAADFRTLKPVKRLTAERRKKLNTRIAENCVDDFTEAIAAIRRSSFLRGDSDRGWRATFDWMLEPKNFTKLIEGTYDR